jgi:hypothetical protein
VVQLPDQLEVLPPGQQLVDGRVLAGQPDRRPQRNGVPHDVETGDPRVPGVRLQQGGEDPHQRRLARAVRAEQAQHPPGLNVQTHADERLDRTERLAQVLDLDHGVGPRQPARLADHGGRGHLHPLVLRPASCSPSRSTLLRIMNSSCSSRRRNQARCPCQIVLLDHAIDPPRVATSQVRGRHRIPVIRHTRDNAGRMGPRRRQVHESAAGPRFVCR